MPTLLTLEKESIIADFNKKINIWCELYSKSNHLPKDEMCNFAVLEFKDVKSATEIRKAISQEFKPKFRVENAKKKQSKKESKKELLKQAIISYAGNVATPLWEQYILLTSKNGKKE